MIADIVTIADLEKFRESLMADIQKLYLEKHKPPKKWLKSPEVRRILSVSPGTLQNLRVNGSLPYTKVGGSIFYDSDDVEKMLVDHKRVDMRHPFSLEKRSALKS